MFLNGARSMVSFTMDNECILKVFAKELIRLLLQ
jgi:hypothetical protein